MTYAALLYQVAVWHQLQGVDMPHKTGVEGQLFPRHFGGRQMYRSPALPPGGQRGETFRGRTRPPADPNGTDRRPFFV